MLPVKFAPPGKIGKSPIRLLMKIKKNTLSKYGRYFSYFGPMDVLAISSRTNKIRGSIQDCNPFGALPSRVLYPFATVKKIHSIKKAPINKDATFLVIEKS